MVRGMEAFSVGLLFAVLISIVKADFYEDMLVDDLYKRLDELEGYFGDYPQDSWLDDDIVVNSRESGQADLRDHEYLEHSASKGGFQYISGGAGEGSQYLTPEGTRNNTQEVKSDESLPFYCHPPNPCPKGMTGKDGCDEDVKDTAEEQKKWIDGMMQEGHCSCDEEHMYNCPKGIGGLTHHGGDEERDSLDRVLDSLMGGSNDIDEDNPFFSKQNKREYIVAKKSPGMFKRSTRNLEELHKERSHNNPYLQGKKIRTVAKKGVRM